ncbi:MAG: thiamine pyrophosphate-binding protein [Caldilineaceae bacterium SB0670_bin_27]|uniref:Thiamine pyrophosphate-binding protein n=1 Tax=Caldilineaceae bacterium SB0664_bin_27 TaxID=2605260 RepID=A0A6B0YTY4_9CHLR|nr:thiamine pyrophosphate-binding protein [Caldilineaceae bacterium SB0664_bin_27]MYJ76644.1 thiamine pyrophosphate-binding protein [Caldilineaceae bacterium SB0670_bin_27]
MARMNGGEALVRSLAAEGLRVVFGVPGAGQYEAIDALYTTPGVRYIAVRHEQAASYMADGYARASGEVAAALVVEGPGLFNALSGVATAYATSSPILVVSGGHHHRKKGLELGEEAWLGPLTKWVGRAESPAAIPGLVQEAFVQLRSGRPRPVGLEVLPSVFASTEEVSLVPPADGSPASVDPDLQAVKRAAEMLVAARRPVIWAGGGVMRAKAATLVAELADYLQIPVVTTRQGKGTISELHPLSLGMAETRFQPLRNWLASRDLILAVGTSHFSSGDDQQVIRIDVDQEEIGGGDYTVAIQGDAYPVVMALNRAVAAAGPSRSDKAEAVQAEVAEINGARFDPSRQLQPQWGFMEAVHAALPDDAIVIQGMNQMGYYSRNYFRARGPRSYLTSSSHGTLGCAYPIALGARVGCPDRVVVSLSGDGGFLYNAQELSTAVQYGINAVAVVFNDNAYGNVLRAQMEEFDGHVLGTRLHNPDFVALAQSFGAHGVLAEDADALQEALEESVAGTSGKPVLIEVPVKMLDREF